MISYTRPTIITVGGEEMNKNEGGGFAYNYNFLNREKFKIFHKYLLSCPAAQLTRK